MSAEQRAAIAALVVTHRAAQRASLEAMAARASMSPVTWKRVEDGKGVQVSTYTGVEAAFGWPAGTIREVADGGKGPDPGQSPVEPRRHHDLVATVLDGPYPDAVKVLLVKAARAADPVDAILDATASDADKVAAVRAIRTLQAGGAESRSGPVGRSETA
ncbi:hypothetical protein [Micromonospora yangpuensis]|nr:hypothetical protein [Micromonospora yangpuensis]